MKVTAHVALNRNNVKCSGTVRTKKSFYDVLCIFSCHLHNAINDKQEKTGA